MSNLLRQIVTNGLISLGMLVVILTGGIDLSVGPVVAPQPSWSRAWCRSRASAAGSHRDGPVRRELAVVSTAS